LSQLGIERWQMTNDMTKKIRRVEFISTSEVKH